MVGLALRLRQVSGKQTDAQGAIPATDQLSESPSRTSSNTLPTPVPSSTPSQSPVRGETASVLSNGSTAFRRSGGGVTYEDLDEWRTRASKGELHFYSRMTIAGAAR